MSLGRRMVLAPIHAYRRWISPALPSTCRYYPSCSSYALEAIETHGVLKGLLLAAWRLARCNPWTRGGVDHVPEPGEWRYRYAPDQPRPLDELRAVVERQPACHTKTQARAHAQPASQLFGQGQQPPRPVTSPARPTAQPTHLGRQPFSATE